MTRAAAHYTTLYPPATNVHRSATLWQSTLTLPNVEKVSNVPRQRIVDLDEEVNAPVGKHRRGLTATAHECHFALHRIRSIRRQLTQRMKSRASGVPVTAPYAPNIYQSKTRKSCRRRH